MTEAADPRLAIELLSPGELMVAVNLGNAATVKVDEGGKLSGPSIEVATMIGDALHLAVTFVRFGAAGQIVAAGEGRQAWDIACLAIDPVRAESLHFTAPYLSIEATYAVPKSSSALRPLDVDRRGCRIASARGAAYHRYLEQILKEATLISYETPADAIAALRAGDVDMLAGVRASLERALPADGDWRLLAKPFATVDHGMAIPKASNRLIESLDRVMNDRVLGLHRKTMGR
jgi:polar amino acid transport system substrate-binding protein